MLKAALEDQGKFEGFVALKGFLPLKGTTSFKIFAEGSNALDEMDLFASCKRRCGRPFFSQVCP